MIKKHPAFTFVRMAICLAVAVWFVQTIKAQNTVLQQQKAELYVPTGHTKSVGHVAFSPDGAIVASVGGYLDNTVKLWNVRTGQELRTLVLEAGGTSATAFSPNGKIIAAGDGDKIALWNVETGLALRTLSGHTSIVTSVVFSPDGKAVASAEKGSKTIKLWNALTGEELGTLSGHTNAIQSVAFSTDGNMMAVGSEDKTVKLWSALTGQGIRTLSGHDGWVISVAFSADGKTLASGSLDRTIKLWSVETGRELKTFSGKTEGVSSVAFSPDGKILASKSNDETMKLWDVETGQQIKSLVYRDPNARREVFSLVPDFKYYRDNYPLTKDKRFQIKIGDNGKLDLYEFKTGTLLGSLVAFDQTDWAVVTPDGLFDGSPSAWKLLSWRLDSNTFRTVPAEAFFTEFYRPGLLADIFAGRRIEKPSRDISTIDIRQPEVKVVLSDAKQTIANITSRRNTVNVIIKDAPADERRKTSSGAKDVRLFRNNSLVNLWRGDVLRGKGVVTLTATVPITAGGNNFTAYAFNNENVKSRDGELIVTGADSLKRKGTAYILAVGVNEYANPQYNLKYAVANAHTFTEEIKTQQEKLGRYERVEITSLLDKEATKRRLTKVCVSGDNQPFT